MKPSPAYSSDLMQASASGPDQIAAPSVAATRVYQALTVVAMLLLLGSLWVF